MRAHAERTEVVILDVAIIVRVGRWTGGPGSPKNVIHVELNDETGRDVGVTVIDDRPIEIKCVCRGEGWTVGTGSGHSRNDDFVRPSTGLVRGQIGQRVVTYGDRLRVFVIVLVTFTDCVGRIGPEAERMRA